MISIVIPVYNSEKWLAKCLDSVINQTYQDLEIILVDDGSTDSSPLICDEYAKKDNRIRVIHQKNRGAIKARLAGLELAEGEWISFIDSDDWLENNMYEKMMDSADDGVGFIWCDVFMEMNNSQIRLKKIQVPEDSDKYLRNLIGGRIPGWMHNKIIRRDLLCDKSIDMTDVHAIFEDVVWTFQILLLNPGMKYVALPLYHYNLHNSEAMTSIGSGELFLKASHNISRLSDMINQKKLLGKYGEDMRAFMMESKLAIAGEYGINKARNIFPEAHKKISAYPKFNPVVRLCYWLFFNSGKIGDYLYKSYKRLNKI